MALSGFRLFCIGLVSLFFLLGSTKETQAQYGPFDPNFGVDGVLTFPDVWNRTMYCCNHQVHVLDDGRILVALSMNNPNTEVEGNTVGVFRFNGRGELDRTFGENGYVNIDWDISLDWWQYEAQKRITSISTDQTGRIIITARTYFYSDHDDSSWGIAVLTAAGFLDETFNASDYNMPGMQTVYYPGRSYAASATYDINNHIVVAGHIGDPCPCTVRLSRFLPTGGADPETIRDFPDYGFPSFAKDALDRYVVVATADNNPSERAIWRVLPSGALDTSFSNDGVLTDSITGNIPTGSAYMQSDNKIVLFHNLSSDFTASRYTEAGELDPSYGNAGRATVTVSDNLDPVLYSKLVDSQDRAVMAGYHYPYPLRPEIVLVRLTTSGQPDPTFGSDGIIRLWLEGTGKTPTVPWSIDEMPDGDLLILTSVDNAPMLIRLDLGDPTDLIQNSGFEVTDSAQASKASMWVGANLTKDRRICNRDWPLTIYAHSGDCAFMFKGNSGENSRITQVIKPVSELRQRGTALTLTAWKNGFTDILGKVVVYYTDGTKQAFSMEMGQANGYREFVSGPFLLAKDASKFKVSFQYRWTNGKSYLDDIALIPNAARRDVLLPLPLPAASNDR